MLLRVTLDKRIHNFMILEPAAVGEEQEKRVTSKNKTKKTKTKYWHFTAVQFLGISACLSISNANNIYEYIFVYEECP